MVKESPTYDNTAMVVGAVMDTLGLKEIRLPMTNLHTVSGAITIDYDIDANIYVIRKWDDAPFEAEDTSPDLSDGSAT